MEEKNHQGHAWLYEGHRTAACRALLSCILCVVPCLACSALGVGTSAARAAEPFGHQWIYVGGAVGEDTEAVKFGVRLDTPWTFPLHGLVATVQMELETGRWRALRPTDAATAPESDQYSLVPVLRFRATPAARRYVELGIGPSWISPLYGDARRRFSTRFQFRDHVAFGWSFGAGRRHDLSVHIEHFSNAGISSPNPGVDLLGVRWALAF